MIIVFVGAPGAGKGTQAKFFVREGWFQLSTGDMFRNLLKENTPFAEEVKEIMNSGKLISDEITSKLFKMNLKKILANHNKIILDGYPRTIKQVKHLETILEELGIKLNVVVNFIIDEKLLFERLTNRRVCPKCDATYNIKNYPPKIKGICDNDGEELLERDDDQSDKIKIRMDAFYKLTEPIINIYDNQNKVLRVDGAEEPLSLFKKIMTELKNYEQYSK